jgi:hypothetical protein
VHTTFHHRTFTNYSLLKLYQTDKPNGSDDGRFSNEELDLYKYQPLLTLKLHTLRVPT